MPCTNTNPAVRRHRTRGAGELVYIQRRRVARLYAADEGRVGIGAPEVTHESTEETTPPPHTRPCTRVARRDAEALVDSQQASSERPGLVPGSNAACSAPCCACVSSSLTTHTPDEQQSGAGRDAAAQMIRRCRLRRDKRALETAQPMEGHKSRRLRHRAGSSASGFAVAL